MISEIIEKRIKKLTEIKILEDNGSNQQSNYTTLPYVPKLSEKFRRKLSKLNIQIVFKSRQTIFTK